MPFLSNTSILDKGIFVCNQTLNNKIIMKKNVLLLTFLVAMNEVVLAQSITLNPENIDEISIIKKYGFGFTHESPNGLLKLGTWVDNDLAFIQTHTNHSLYLAVNDALSGAFMKLSTNGNIGIGTASPIANLHVAGYNPVTTGQGHFFYYNAGLSTNPSYGANLSILADYGIVSKTYVGAAISVIASDNRIKNIIGLSNNEADLARLRKIEITDYRMKDVATWGNQTFKKVIAQQVESLYPEAIKMQTDVIPDIYVLSEKTNYDAANKKLTVSLLKNYEIKVGEKIEMVHPRKGKIRAEVVAVAGNSFTVKDWEYATENVFVFGREVNDFRSVDYEALSMLGISAIQQLAKDVEELRVANAELRIKNEKLESKNNKTEARLDAIEASLKTLNTVPTGK